MGGDWTKTKRSFCILSGESDQPFSQRVFQGQGRRRPSPKQTVQRSELHEAEATAGFRPQMGGFASSEYRDVTEVAAANAQKGIPTMRRLSFSPHLTSTHSNPLLHT
eukprot:4790598-Prymnesium_polylepis.1